MDMNANVSHPTRNPQSFPIFTLLLMRWCLSRSFGFTMIMAAYRVVETMPIPNPLLPSVDPHQYSTTILSVPASRRFRIHMIDFGLAKSYLTSDTHRYIALNDNKSLKDRVCCVSIDIHLGLGK